MGFQPASFLAESAAGHASSAAPMTKASAFVAPGRTTPEVTRWLRLKPASTDRRFQKLRSSNPAPVTPKTTSSSWLRVNVVSILGAWDPDAIQRIVVNLITAARRCSLVEGGEVSVDVMSGREGAALVVRAEGKAPREDEIEAFFEPWKRAAPPGDRRRLGSGLGLYIARELVLAHGGRLSWEQAGPTTFVLRVVLPPASPPAPRRV